MGRRERCGACQGPEPPHAMGARASRKVAPDGPGESLRASCRVGDRAGAATLLDQRADVNSSDPVSGQAPRRPRQPAHPAGATAGGACRRRTDRAPVLLVSSVVAQEGRTPLIWAAWEGHTQIVQLLLDWHASLDFQDNVSLPLRQGPIAKRRRATLWAVAIPLMGGRMRTQPAAHLAADNPSPGPGVSQVQSPGAPCASFGIGCDGPVRGMGWPASESLEAVADAESARRFPTSAWIELHEQSTGLFSGRASQLGYTALMRAAWKGNVAVLSRLVASGAGLELRDRVSLPPCLCLDRRHTRCGHARSQRSHDARARA